MRLRKASPDDLGLFVAFDHVAQRDEQRRLFIATAIEETPGTVAERDGLILGFLVTGQFFGSDFIDLFYVADGSRRSGIGSALIAEAGSTRRTEKLFTSTNLSNKPMQSLLEGRGLPESIEWARVRSGLYDERGCAMLRALRASCLSRTCSRPG